jgi:hypothetical protein
VPVLTIVQTGAALSGTFTQPGLNGGTLTGTIVNNTASVTLMYRYEDCPILITGGDRWSGTASQNCTGLVMLPPSGPIPIQFVRTR